jgi:TolA-binding protein
LALQQGSAALGRRDYAAAEAAAKEVLATRGPRAYDAQLLLAEALMGKRDYQQAALAYDDTYNKSRTGAHAQDALLGLANSLVNINEKRAACDTLNKLRAEFPQPRADIKESVGVMRQRAGCA